MKVVLDVNLKIGNGKIISAGSVYSDTNGPIPDFILRRLNRKQAHVIPDGARPAPVPPVAPVTDIRKKGIQPAPPTAAGGSPPVKGKDSTAPKSKGPIRKAIQKA